MKIRKPLCLIICLFIFATSFSGCGGKNDSCINWLLSSSPKNLDPQTASSESELLIIKNCFTGLFEKSSDGELISTVVNHYDVSKNGLKYVFHLNDNIFWSVFEKGKLKKYAPVTAHDFVFAIRRVFRDNPKSAVMNVLSGIKNADKVIAGEPLSKLSVSAENNTTLVINLSEKNPALPEAFTSPELFPCNEKFFESTNGSYGLSGSSIISNGSFTLQSWGESYIKLTQNKFSNDVPNVSSLILFNPKDSREQSALLANGSIDAALMNSDKIGSVDAKSFDIKKRTSVIWAIIFNPANELWKNENLRKAVFSCTDRSVFSNSKIINPCSRIISETATVFSENYRKITGNIASSKFNSAQAKQLYSAALSELNIGSIYNSPILVEDSETGKSGFSALNQVYQRELSLYFSPEYLSAESIKKKIRIGDFAAAVIGLPITCDIPSCTLEYFSQDSTGCIFPIGGANFGKTLSEAYGASGSKQAAALYCSCERVLYSSCLVNPLFSENNYFVSSRSVSWLTLDNSAAVIFKGALKK